MHQGSGLPVREWIYLIQLFSCSESLLLLTLFREVEPNEGRELDLNLFDPLDIPGLETSVIMSVIQTCQDFKDTLDLFRHQGLYLKPVSRMNISVQLPQLKKSGAKISNWEVMEKVKEMAKPFHFPVFKVRVRLTFLV